MIDQGDPLARIAAALERLAPAPVPSIDWTCAPAYVWDGAGARPVARIEAPVLDLLRGIDPQKHAVTVNVTRLAGGHAAHDMLLWGARGMGKSVLIRASVAAAQVADCAALALVQVAPEALPRVPLLFAALARAERRFLVFFDDLGFEDGDGAGPRALRSWLEGGVEARPANVRLAVTSNRRAIVPRHASEQDDPLNPRDAVDDRLALADRFGLSLGFHVCSQDDYLAIVAGYAAAYRLTWEEADALEWARRRGARSGRAAWQYVTELAGRAGVAL
ncbi:MAG: DUF815 domain-containing protein [Novosphingobium sp.]|nr:DUF815 domain-containing protein [Novosphingobium sp.]